MVNRIEQLKVLTTEQPENAFALFALAKEYEKIGDFQKSIETFEDLITKQPSYLGAYYHFGKVLESVDLTEKAQKAYESGILVAQQQKDLHALSELKNALQNLLMELL